MDVIESQVNPRESSFLENTAYHRALADELRQRLAIVRQGGGEKYQARHAEQGKLFVRERIDRLLDSGSPFLELSPLAAWEMYGNRKSTRLNSSHVASSYAVFCLKKKRKTSGINTSTSRTPPPRSW